jgi:hypothetical protein
MERLFLCRKKHRQSVNRAYCELYGVAGQVTLVARISVLFKSKYYSSDISYCCFVYLRRLFNCIDYSVEKKVKFSPSTP